MKKQNIVVSVVIPAYNEASYIDRLLDALADQTFEDFEVIVSDAQSKDGTKEVVERYHELLHVRLLQTPPRGPAAGRNAGAALAKGEWLLFLDADDDIDDPDFIAAMVRESEQRGWQTAGVKLKVKHEPLTSRVGNYINYRYIKLLAHTKHPVAPGYCILTKRALFEKNGGFNEKIQFGEDYDYVSRVGKHGFGFVTSTHIYIDLRRVKEEGWRLVYKGIANEIYRHTHKYNLEKNPFRYEFGNHKSRK